MSLIHKNEAALQRQTRVSSRLDSREKLGSQSQYQSRKLIFLNLSLNLSLRY